MQQYQEASVAYHSGMDGIDPTPLHCSACGHVIAKGSLFTRRVLPATGNVQWICAACEPFRLVTLPSMPDRVTTHRLQQ